jgi:hypothetical protein
MASSVLVMSGRLGRGDVAWTSTGSLSGLFLVPVLHLGAVDLRTRRWIRLPLWGKPTLGTHR